MIKQHLEQAKNNILAEKRTRIESAKSIAMREIVAPHNNEIEQSLQKAIAELAHKRDLEIAVIQKAFNEETSRLVEIANKNKADFEACTLSGEESRINVLYDATIASIDKAIENAKEQ